MVGGPGNFLEERGHTGGGVGGEPIATARAGSAPARGMGVGAGQPLAATGAPGAATGVAAGRAVRRAFRSASGHQHNTRSRVTTVHGTTINASINPSINLSGTPAITAAMADRGVRSVDGGSRNLPAAVEKRNPAGRTPAQERCTAGTGCIRAGAGVRHRTALAPSSDGIDRR